VLGGLAIETEHLLLGILKEQREPALTHLLDTMKVTADGLRHLIYARIGPATTRVDTSVEIPFSKEAKHVLQYTAEEADRLLHRHIGTEHLLLGLLRVERGLAWDVLHEKGLSITPVREALVMYVSATSPAPPEIAWMFPDHREHAPRSSSLYIMTTLKGPNSGRRSAADSIGSGSFASAKIVGFSTPADRPPDGRMHSIGPISMSGTTLPEFALVLEQFLGAPVMVEDAGLNEIFDIELQGEYDNPETLIAALRDQLGLVLTKSL
jgi:hypothetical protein